MTVANTLFVTCYMLYFALAIHKIDFGVHYAFIISNVMDSVLIQ